MSDLENFTYSGGKCFISVEKNEVVHVYITRNFLIQISQLLKKSNCWMEDT